GNGLESANCYQTSRSGHLQSRFRRASFQQLSRAGWHKQNVIGLHLDVVGFGLQKFLERHWSLRQTRRPLADDACSTQLRSRVRSTGKRDGLQYTHVPALHQKAAWLENVSDNIDHLGDVLK